MVSKSSIWTVFGPFVVLALLTLPMASATVASTGVVIESDTAFGGISDYDPQIWSNSRGELVVIYGRDQGLSPERISVRYSENGGLTWSSRIVLFSTAAQGDGIIDSDRGGMWEYSGEVVKDVLYLVLHLDSPPARMAFTKVNIGNIRNVASFSSWMSANGRSVPSSGEGSDGSGYDIIAPADYIDPSIAVKSSNDILVTLLGDTASTRDSIFSVRWNGDSWIGASSPNLVKDHNTATQLGLARVRHTRDGNWVAAYQVPETTGVTDTTFIVALTCNPSSPTTCDSTTGWTGFDGTGDFDFVIDTGAGNFGWPIIYPDSADRIHVIASTEYLISGWRRMFHNYWDGTSWVNSETQNAAGTQVDITVNGISEPRLNQAFLNANVDSGGQLITMLTAGNGPSGAGAYSFIWDGDWSSDDYVFQNSRSSSRVVNEGFMRGTESVSPFLLSDGTTMVYVGVSGAIAGQPWWDTPAPPVVEEREPSRLAFPPYVVVVFLGGILLVYYSHLLRKRRKKV